MSKISELFLWLLFHLAFPSLSWPWRGFLREAKLLFYYSYRTLYQTRIAPPQSHGHGLARDPGQSSSPIWELSHFQCWHYHRLPEARRRPTKMHGFPLEYVSTGAPPKWCISQAAQGCMTCRGTEPWFSASLIKSTLPHFTSKLLEKAMAGVTSVEVRDWIIMGVLAIHTGRFE